MPELSSTSVETQGQSEKVFSVTEINRKAKWMLESEFAGVWMEGEISNFKHHSSGHMYLSLKDESSQITAVFFSRSNQKVKFEIKDGLKVTVYGKISLYEARGQYQFYIEKMEPQGLGALQLAFLQLKEKLEKKGMFLSDHKKPIPRFPTKVGVVTSPTGAAIRDILNVVNRRFQGTHVIIYPARVQGEGAAPEIAEGIQEMNRMAEVDVLIVGRGGGSIEDLWCFNEEIVANAVFNSKIPIISAVGHEIDWTICDMVADLRAPTPSAAAELVVQNREELENKVMDFSLRIRKALLGFLEIKKQKLESILSSYAFRQPRLMLEEMSQRLDELMRQLTQAIKVHCRHKLQSFQAVVGQLNALSPLAILQRGYSLSFDAKGKLLKDVSKLKVKDSIKVKLLNGSVDAVVSKVEKDKES